MDQKQALAKIKKLLGPNATARVNAKARPADERAAAGEEMDELSAKIKAAKEAQEARRAELLAADPAYQALKAESDSLEAAHTKARHIHYNVPITVGVSNGIFNDVKAEGDNWAEVIEQLTGKCSIAA